MSSRLSGLSTRGRCLLAGGLATAVCSIVLAERDLLRVGAFVALLPLLCLLLAARTRRRVRVSRSVTPARVGVGGDVAVALELTGVRLVGALRLVDAVPDAAGPLPSAPPRFTVHRLSGRGSAHLSYPLRPRLRGVHAIGPVTVGVSDPLALAEFAHAIEGTQRLVVLPRVVALRGLPAALTAGVGTSGAVGHRGHGSPGVMIRQYRRGDELRRVHWRSTARRGEIMVRVEERPQRHGTCVLLDRRDSAHSGRGADASLEFAVSTAASICAHLLSRGEPVRLVTEDGTSVTDGPRGAVTGLDPLLDALAALRPSARADLTGPELPAGTAVVAVLGALAPGHVEGLLARRSGVGHAILLDTPTWDATGGRPGGTAAAADALARAGWIVTVARAGEDPDQVWDRLTTAVGVAV